LVRSMICIWFPIQPRRLGCLL